VQHKQLQAETVTTDQDQGTFTALVSAWEADRENDVILSTAFDRTIEAWQRSGKRLPLLFEHSTTVVGSVDPGSMKATEEGLVVSGEVDRSTAEGEQVWKTIKAGTAGFSIGYVSEDRRRVGGGRELYEIDLLEITATSKPMHPATRALSWKSANVGLDERTLSYLTGPILAEDQPPTLEELEAKAKALGIDDILRKSQPIRIESFPC
jgi:HK97 family phage prohead protease